MSIHRHKVETPRIPGLDRGLREAAATLLRTRWPTNTAKQAARAYGLSLDQAKEAARGRASLGAIERIMQAGDMSDALHIVEAVRGQSIANHFREMRAAHEANGRRLAALFGPSDLGDGAGDRVAAGGSRVGPDVGGDAGRRTGSR